jgi:hypothetical protein
LFFLESKPEPERQHAMTRLVRYEDYIAREKEIVEKDNNAFVKSLVEKQQAEAEQPIATFFDGLNFVVRRPMDTYNSSQKKQRVFENRPTIVGDDVADFSLTGVLISHRPELVRNFDDESEI